jgi:hypothetical protein
MRSRMLRADGDLVEAERQADDVLAAQHLQRRA